MPYVSLHTTANLAGQLSGRRYHDRPDDPWTIRRAEQITKFEMDEQGARVRVEASLGVDPFSAAPRLVPRRFIYDQPFFIFLWRADADWPYLALWVGNDAVLQRF